VDSASRGGNRRPYHGYSLTLWTGFFTGDAREKRTRDQSRSPDGSWDIHAREDSGNAMRKSGIFHPCRIAAKARYQEWRTAFA